MCTAKACTTNGVENIDFSSCHNHLADKQKLTVQQIEKNMIDSQADLHPTNRPILANIKVYFNLTTEYKVALFFAKL
mgnify:FL=1